MFESITFSVMKYAQSPPDGKFSGVACDTIAVRMTPTNGHSMKAFFKVVVWVAFEQPLVVSR